MDHNNNLFADNQQFNAYDNLNLFPSGSDSNFNEAGWGVNASDYGSQSRGQLPAVNNGWQQNANHLSNPGYSGQASPYGRNLNQSPASFNQNQYQNFGQPQQQQSFQPYGQSLHDQSLFSRPSSGQNFHATITPQALDRNVQTGYGGSPYGNPAFPNAFNQNSTIRPNSTPLQARPVNQKILSDAVPKGQASGMFSIINFDTLSRSTNTERMGNYVNIGKEPLEWGITRSVVPSHAPRKSRNELRALAANNPTALAKIGKKTGKKTKSYPNLLSDIKSASASASSAARVKYEQDTSSSEESTSDDDSEYTDDDDEDSPLPAKRPDNPKAGVEYDTIKALWRSKRKTLSSESIRKGLVDFWDLVKNIRDRWKKDAQDVTDAEENKQTGQLPLLQSRVKDQRDMIESAFKAALKHGHRGLLELLAENVALMFLCYQFLLDRIRADDFNGGLARAILETMSLCTTLTNEKIEKTHVGKVLPRYTKRGDAKTQFYVKKIMANADIADKEAASKPEPPKTDTNAAGSTDGKTTAAPAKRTAPEAVAGVKRAATTSTTEGTAPKKAAVTTTKTNGVNAVPKVNGAVKKPASTSDAAKSTASATNATTTRKTVVPKSSGFFSSLQSASKKPGTSNADKAAGPGAKPANKTSAPKPAFSFAETMASLAKPKEEKPAAKPQKEVPPETPEEREKRLRKEKRRKLRVTFKTGEELVQIRYFTHDPQEEIGHDSSQMRDMTDVGGEGRMLKQQAHMMDIDDEDDVIEEVGDLKEFTTPSLVDFSVVDEEERKRNYAPYGGGEQQPDSKERAVRDEYENNNLIVIYTDSSEIPPNPREPADPYTGEPGQPLRYFGTPEEKYSNRAQAKRSQQSSNATGGFDIAAFMRKQQQQQPQQQQPAAPPMNADVMSILASLQKAAPAQATPPPPQVPAFGQPYMGAQQPPVPPPPPPPAGLDLGAILASLNAGGGQQPNYGAQNSAPMMGYGQGNNNDPDVERIRASGNPNYKTRVCKFWQEGRCHKGESCSFLHE
ncbi:hypothetical protein PRZ48_004831 [Zasmidium cellare]|uniref:C3H1-type domain-containing protein n=1 Tax=Zasmidium cellare TaxID=395010 RepID=A0ABR0ES14_ZASCE|nr:hypothetical protein PRZ48_004831 [Zasmidium cellare]